MPRSDGKFSKGSAPTVLENMIDRTPSTSDGCHGVKMDKSAEKAQDLPIFRNEAERIAFEESMNIDVGSLVDDMYTVTVDVFSI